MKKILVVCLVLFTLCGLLNVWGGAQSEEPSGSAQPAGSAEKKELNVWIKKTFIEESNASIKAKLEAFGAANNCTVNAEIISSADMNKKLNAAIEGGNAPDVALLTNSQVSQYAENGLLVDVGGLVDAIDAAEGTIAEATKTVVTVGGKLMGAPYWGESQLLHYRKDLLAKAGYTRPPATWEEFREIAKAVTGIEPGVYGAGLVMGPAMDCEIAANALLWGYGASVWKKDGVTPNLNNPNTVAALKVWVDMYNEDKSMPASVVSWNGGGNNQTFLAGQSAMVINGGSLYKSIMDKADYADLQPVTGVALIPGGPAGVRTPATIISFSIFKQSENVDLAKELIKYVFDKEWYSEWIRQTAPLTSPVFVDVQKEAFWQDPVNKVFLDDAEKQVQWGYPGETNEYVSAAVNTFTMSQVLQKILVEGMPIEAALAEMDAKLKALVK
jgi:multiple sugar transport system substrate-binding protein